MDDEKRIWTFETIVKSIKTYIESSHEAAISSSSAL
jgi:hypothetical protein